MLPPTFGTVQHFSPFLLQMAMTFALIQQGRENRETYHQTFFWWHLPDTSLQSMKTFSICQDSITVLPKKGLGKANSFHALSCSAMAISLWGLAVTPW